MSPEHSDTRGWPENSVFHREEAHVNKISGTSAPDASLSIRLPRREVYAAAKPFSGLAMLAIGVVGIVALYVAREVFVPLALAILLSFALGPLVMLLRRWYCGRVPSVVVAVVL